MSIFKYDKCRRCWTTYRIILFKIKPLQASCYLRSVGSVESNEAVHISLVLPNKTLHTFHPTQTYSIFGDKDTIFGYQKLKINLKYHASDMRPILQITYSKKFSVVGTTAPTDLKPILEAYLPQSILSLYLQ
jgi:hypothetical protein